MKQNAIAELSLFEGFEVRKVYHHDERYFPLNDIVGVLTQSKNVVDYIKKLKLRDQELSKGWGQIVTPLLVQTRGGAQKMNCSNTKGALRIIQSINSPRAEPFKKWLASLGNERIEEINSPELGIQRAKARAIEVWRSQGHDEKWISKRIQSIDTRNAFTDLLKARGIKQGFEYALLTNKVYSVGLGVPGGASEYKDFKGIKKNENLRDHMDQLEIALVDLAEAGSQKIMEEWGSEGFEEVQDAVVTGSSIAGEARERIEDQIGKPIISSKNFRLKKKE